MLEIDYLVRIEFYRRCSVKIYMMTITQMMIINVNDI